MNKKLLTPLFVAASFMMIACSAKEIVARPAWINDPIVEEDVKDKTLKEIYDAIKKLGDTNANVLNKVMYDIARKNIGTFVDITKKDEEGKIVVVEKGWLKAIANGEPEATDEAIDSFVESHPIYKSDEKTYVLEDGKAKEKSITEAADKRKNSVAKIKAMYERIYENIFQKLFDEIKGGSYSTKLDQFFEEDYFVQHLYKEMYYEDYNPEVDPFSLAKSRVFLPKTANQKWSDYVNIIDGSTIEGKGFLHLDSDGKGNFTKYYKDYISRKVLPEIYRTLLIETYVREQRETNLGRSYARKVNMITIPKNADVDSHIRTMLNTFAKTEIAVSDDTPATNFEPIKDAMVGIAAPLATSTTETALHEAGFDRLQVNGKDFIWGVRTISDGHKDTRVETEYEDTYVYRGTKLFDIVDKYLKIMDVTYTEGTPTGTHNDFKFAPKSHLTSDEQSAYDDLTNKGAYTVEKGLEIKEREIRLTDMTTDGWFLKSSGVSGLGQEFSDKLFNITTSNIIDKQVEKDIPDVNDTVRYFGSPTPDTSGRLSKRKAYVFDPHSDANVSAILDDSSNFYIVEVEEAASASKLSAEATSGSYLELKAGNASALDDTNKLTNEIYSKVTEQVANSDTYKKNAEQYYLMISNIVFYDQSVYDYFKSQFPDLFK